jgi:hypothetical protein
LREHSEVGNLILRFDTGRMKTAHPAARKAARRSKRSLQT